MRRLLVDASTLLAGVAGRPQGTPALLLSALVESKFEAVVCPQLLDEVARGLAGKYFRERVDEQRAKDILASIAEAAIHFPNTEKPEPVLRDPKDDYLVALAKASAAEAIVSGDRDLLDHTGLQPPAITTRDACQQLGLITPKLALAAPPEAEQPEGGLGRPT